MKKILQYILLFVLLSFWVIALTNRDSVKSTVENLTGFNKPCLKPIEYAIGEVDPKFGISKDQLAVDAAQAEKIWENTAGKNLFQYDPEAEFKINLIFDERQQQTIESEKLEKDLESLDLAHESALKDFASLSSSYDKRLKKYDAGVADYEKQLKKYNEDVAYWNNHGGAPEKEYKDLKEERTSLKNIFADLEKERMALNDLAGKTNQVVKKENELANNYNANLETYRSKFGSSREFEKGVYDGQAINIYEFKENSDLEMTIIHEMGHALGIGHLNNPDSIMYYLMGEQNLKNPKLTDEDLSALKNVCQIN